MRKDLYRNLQEKEETHFWHRAKRQLVADFIVQYYPKDKGSTRILDIGCGTGGNIKALQRFGRVWGIDASKHAIALCRMQGLQNVRLEKAEKTSFNNNSFDIITILDLLEHTDDRQVIKEAYRIVKKGGLVILTVPAYQLLWSTWDRVLGHKRRYSRKSLNVLLSTQHFQILKLSYCYSFLLLPAMIIRVIKSFLYKYVDYPSDFALGGVGFGNTFLGTLSAWERLVMLKLNLPIPFGLTIVAVCRK